MPYIICLDPFFRFRIDQSERLLLDGSRRARTRAVRRSDSFKPISLPLRAQVHTTQERGEKRPKRGPPTKNVFIYRGKRSEKIEIIFIWCACAPTWLSVLVCISSPLLHVIIIHRRVLMCPHALIGSGWRGRPKELKKRVAKKRVCYLVRHELGQYHLRMEGVRPSAPSAFTFPLNQPRHPCLSSLSITARTDRVGQKKRRSLFLGSNPLMEMATTPHHPKKGCK